MIQDGKPSRILSDVRETMARFRTTREETRLMWLKARQALLDAQRMREIAKAQIEEMAQDNAELRFRFQNTILPKILESAINKTSADMGYVQQFDPGSGAFKILVHQGFRDSFLDRISMVEGECPSFATALQRGARLIVEDITASEIFLGNPRLEVLLGAGVRALQSTPLIGSIGQFLGVLSTHHRTPRRLRPNELHLLDYYSNQAAHLLECHHALPEQKQLAGDAPTNP